MQSNVHGLGHKPNGLNLRSWFVSCFWNCRPVPRLKSLAPRTKTLNSAYLEHQTSKCARDVFREVLIATWTYCGYYSCSQGFQMPVLPS